MSILSFYLFFLTELSMSIFGLGWTWKEFHQDYQKSHSVAEHIQPADLLDRIGDLMYAVIPLYSDKALEAQGFSKSKISEVKGINRM
jgi:hypothetical protein